MAKLAFDWVLVFPLIGALLPLFCLIALLVKLDSPGPILYRRRVLGCGGMPFDAFKFRTMFVDGEAILARDPELMRELRANEKLHKDPRITRLGRWLRRLSLDELPQLFNVAMAQMSLVGPRMISPPELSRYGAYQDELLSVKPGLTGLWQVSGRASLSYEQRVGLDIDYIREHSLRTDLNILFVKTPLAVLRCQGAY